MLRRFLTATLVAAILPLAHAQSVEVTFTGSVSSTANVPGVQVGDPASGSWTYDPSALEVDLGMVIGTFFDTDSQVTLDVAGFTGSAANLDARVVDEDVGPRDQIDWTTFWTAGNAPSVSGPLFELGSFFSLRISIVDESGLSLASETLPPSIDAADWDLVPSASRVRISYDSAVCCAFIEIDFDTLISTTGSIDTDGDGVADDADNCIEVANPGQQDSNGDGYGNICDPDLNNDGVVNPVDLGLFKSVFFTNDADADFNSDGVVNPLDLGRLKLYFFQPPGPSALAP